MQESPDDFGERRLRHFLIKYYCAFCGPNKQHEYKWGKGAKNHELPVDAYTVGEAVLKAEADIYIRKEDIFGIREQVFGFEKEK